MVSVDRIRLKLLIREHPRKARALQALLDDPNNLVTALAMVNNFVNLLASSIATLLLYRLLNLTAGETALLATSIVTFYLLILGEITPKNLGKNNPERMTLFLIVPLWRMAQLVRPLTAFFRAVSDALLRVLPQSLRSTEQIHVSEDQIRLLIELSEERGLLKESEADMIRRIFTYDDLHVKQVMTPRSEVVSLEENQTPADLVNVFKEASYTRFPVYQERPENIIGFVNIKDVLKAIIEDPHALKRPIRTWMQPILYVPANKTVSALFAQMQREHIPMVAVVEEYSDVVGIVTLKDLAGEIVGRLEDEHALKEEPLFERVDEQRIRVDGHLRIDEANEELGLRLPERDEYQTIAGFILFTLERVPQEGETLAYNDLLLTVEKMKGPRIEKVLIQGL
jgi:CBS domain containing-hemolysin-like protein